MKSRQINRREFVQNVAAGAVGAAGFSAVVGMTRQAAAAPDTSKILNYNENMEYRRLGKTNLMVSAVCLGGHTSTDGRLRRDIVGRAIDLGINYIDSCSDYELLRDCAALKGRRDQMYLALSDDAREPRELEYRTAKRLLKVLDNLLKKSGQEYTDLWRITCLEPGGRHTFNTSCEIVEALSKAKEQGKARFVGFSSHDRRWTKFMIEYFPEIDVVCFPFTTMSKAAPKDSLFAALKKCDVGAFGIKPFAAASLFRDDPEENNKRARLAIRYILHSNTVHPIPGVDRVEELDNIAKAVMERRQFDVAEKAALEGLNRETMAKLPPQYQWLKQWEYV